MATPAELLEHETIRVGHALRSPSPLLAVLTQRRFEMLARFNDEHRGKYFAIGHQRLTARHHVGYVEVDGLAIEILPKADGWPESGETRRVWRDGLLEMIASAIGIRLRAPTWSAQQTGRASLLDLIADGFLTELSTLLHQGLARGYRDEERNSPTFRGRLLVSEHVRANAVRADRFYVRTQAYDRDILIHRILGAALAEIEEACGSRGILARAAECRAAFPEVGSVQSTAATFERLRLVRSTARYERALALARIILEHRAPRLRAGRARVLALLFDMNLLWEQYIAALFRRASGAELGVSTQERRSFWECKGDRRGIRPDLVVRSRRDGRVLLVADTKWKPPHGATPADDDLKQMFVYNEMLGAPRAVLIYPGASEGRLKVGNYRQRDHGCETVRLAPVSNGNWSSVAIREQVARLLSALVPPARANVQEGP